MVKRFRKKWENATEADGKANEKEERKIRTQRGLERKKEPPKVPQSWNLGHLCTDRRIELECP